MTPANLQRLLDQLCTTCVRQFGFNLRRLRTEMRFVSTEAHGKDHVHVFRASGSHALITLKGSFASLREQSPATPHWTDELKTHFKSTDAQIDAELAAAHAHVETIRQSALYQDHREFLLSHYSDWPGHVTGRDHPKGAARALIESLAAESDARLAEFSEKMASTDAEFLAHQLLMPCHLEIDASRVPPFIPSA